MAVELLNCDCMEYMATQPDNAFDLAIVDPPYGIGDFLMQSSGGNIPKKETIRNYDKADCEWNNEMPTPEYFIELRRVSINQIIWGANYYNCFSGKGGALIWYKNMGHPNLSACEIASVSMQKKVDYVYIQNLNGFVSKETRIHPCQKPMKLYTYVLDKYVKPNQRIIDTHLGSGSSAIASHYFGCDFVGCEIDKDYYNAAVNRFNNETKQVSMF